MKWPKKIKVGGFFVKLIIGERRIVHDHESEYCSGEFREQAKEIEISQGEDVVDCVLHELVHAIQYSAGKYSDPDPDTDSGWEDNAAHRIRAFLLDNADFVRDLLEEIEGS